LRRNRNLVYAVLGLLVLEMFVVARNSRDTFDTNTVVMPGEKKFLDEHPGDYRIINPINSNSGMSIGAQDMWGSDPGVVRRYAEFATWSQGGDPDQATQYVQFAKFDPLYAMLRLKYVFVTDQNQFRHIEAPAAPLPRLLLVSKYRVLKKRDMIFAAMREPFFDPRKEVLLESPPTPAPVESGDPGTVKLMGSSTDEMTLEADLAQPAVLLITDLYTPGWKAVSLEGSVQEHYDLLPANYIIRAIPLAAGHHHLKVEYAPIEYRIGKWISILAWLAFVGGVVGLVVRRNRVNA